MEPEFKGYFYIKSRQTGKVLDVRGSNHKEDAEVIIWHLKYEEVPEEKQLWNQHWKYNPKTGALESRLNGFCLDVVKGNAYNGAEVVNHSANFAPNQTWYFKPEDGTIQNGLGEMWVLDVEGKDASPRSVVVSLREGGGPGSSQQWDMVPYVPTSKLLPKGFYIRSYLNDDHFLQIKDGNDISIGKKGDSKCQRWTYNDKTRAICSVESSNGYAIEAPEAANSVNITAQPPSSSIIASQAWTFERNGAIVSGLSGPGTPSVLEAKGEPGTAVVLSTFDGGKNQQWYISFE